MAYAQRLVTEHLLGLHAPLLNVVYDTQFLHYRFIINGSSFDVLISKSLQPLVNLREILARLMSVDAERLLERGFGI